MPHLTSEALTGASSALRRRDVLLALAGAGLAARAGAQAAFPSRPMSIIVPYTAGGSSDIGGRLMASELGKQLGQTITVDNVPGASGALGMQKLARSPADGHTLVYAGLSEALLVPQINPAAGYRPDDLVPVGMAGSSPVCVVTRPDFPANTIDELVALARSRPGRLSFGSAGIGSFAHVMGELIKDRTGTFMVHIPYRGGAQILTDLIGGQIDLAITTVVSAAQMVATKRLKMLGVTARERIPNFRDVPTFEESQALKGLDVQVWAVMYAPAGLPDAVAQRLNTAINAALVSPTVLETFARLGAELPPRTLTIPQTRAFLQAQAALYQPVTRRIKPE